MDIKSVNNASYSEFMRIFGTVVEHHRQCTEEVFSKRPFKDVDQFVSTFHSYLDSITICEKEAILKKHPMLGTKTEMTKFSVLEQKNAGLDRLAQTEAAVVAGLNVRYFEKFGFPFIVCVKEIDKSTIMQEMERRNKNEREAEILNAMEEVKKIVKHRVRSLIVS